MQICAGSRWNAIRDPSNRSPEQTRIQEKSEPEETIVQAICHHALRPPSNEMPRLSEKLPERVEQIVPLRTIEPCGINAAAEDEWVEIEVAIGSGATETVTPEETLDGTFSITESATRKRGVAYEDADGAQIPSLGERKFLGVMGDGNAKEVTAQVCALKKC